jgi:hypothetical protein
MRTSLLASTGAHNKGMALLVTHGLMHPSTNPLNIVFAAWMRMFVEMLQAKGVAAKLRTLLAPPG